MTFLPMLGVPRFWAGAGVVSLLGVLLLTGPTAVHLDRPAEASTHHSHSMQRALGVDAASTATAQLSMVPLTGGSHGGAATQHHDHDSVGMPATVRAPLQARTVASGLQSDLRRRPWRPAKPDG